MALYQVKWALISHAQAWPRHCPICGYKGAFKGFGVPVRTAAQCARCGSLERHRLLALAIMRKDVDLIGKDVIHVAAEPELGGIVQAAGPQRYRTSQYPDGKADLHLNLEELALPDASLDVMIANHVLEHVDDRKALAEIYRVLKPGGEFVCMVPIIEGWRSTYERPDIVSPSDRAVHYGQSDHLRYYGADLRERFAEAGFALRELDAGPADAIEFGLQRGEKIFVARK